MVISNATSQFFIYLALAIVPSFISLVLYLSPKKESKLKSEQYRTMVLENLFYNSLFLTLGGWITFFSQDYIYIIIAFFIGGINFFKDLSNYYLRVKRIIDQNAKVEEIIIENYDAIIAMFKSSSSYGDFQKKISVNFAFSNEIIFNLYKSFKDFREDSNNSKNTTSSSEDYLADSYKQLGLQSNASRDDVRKAFREKARKLHPDFTGNNDDTDFKKLNDAYQKIMDNL
jgi:hypothetical protein